jgi:hypothetical protein
MKTTNDTLFDTLNDLRANQLASFHNVPNGARRLKAINNCFETIAGNLNQPKRFTAALLLARSRSAYICACGASMAGSTAESFAMNRLCIEAAGYALLVHTDPKLEHIWWHRDTDAKSKKSARNELASKAVERCLFGHDRKLANIFSSIYDWAIDWGAHPNEKSVTGSMTMTETSQEVRANIVFIEGRAERICFAMKSSAEAGLCSLKIFEIVFRARFELLGISEQLKGLGSNMVDAFKPPAGS